MYITLLTLLLTYFLFTITVPLFITNGQTKQLLFRYINILYYIVFCFVIVFMTAQRELVGDTYRYEIIFRNICELNPVSTSSGYYLLNKMVCVFSGNFSFLLVLISALLIMSYSIFIRCISVEFWFVFLLLFVSNTIFFQLSASAMRQSLAVTFIIVAIYFLYKNRSIYKALLLLTLAPLFHFSSIVFCLALIVMYAFGRKEEYLDKNIIYIWLGSQLFSIFGLFEPILSKLMTFIDLGAGRNDIYLKGAVTTYQTGFRLDFLLLSLAPISLFYIYKNTLKYSYGIVLLFKIYLTFNIIATTMNFIPYSDRLYAYSWSLSPILMTLMMQEIVVKKKDYKIYWLLYIFVILTSIPAFIYNHGFLHNNWW